METVTTGNAAEAAVMNAFVSLGFRVLVPFGGGHAYDLAVDLDPGFARVQCKAARTGKGCLKFNSCSTDHGRGRSPYTGLADLFGVYSQQTRQVYIVPVAGAPDFVVSLRLEPSLNNQKRRIRLAADYEIERWSSDALREVVARPQGFRARPAA